ncbi:MFS transporter [Flaviflexus salsibiostraticola]|uniref:MFS transporter n=2 Tax=Flaviflexus salsibiostraticola TaxID=1282737 RepID=A0A3S8Z729_9ACTO|nr:MFS transporter [Flaviflexus salsibiostraticola]
MAGERMPIMKRTRPQPTASEKAQRWLLWTATAIITAIAFEALAVTTAMPTVTRDLDGEHLFALANGITLAAQLITTALAGQWVDAKGVKPALFIGLSAFAVGLVICTAAPTIEIFTIGRLVQGLGGGLCVVPLYVLVGRLVPAAQQPKFFAFFAAAWVVPSLVGPAISGFLVQQIHWRWVFAIVPTILVFMLPAIGRVLAILPPMEFTGNLSRIPRTALLAFGTGGAAIILQVLSGTTADDFTVFTYVAIGVSMVAALAFVRPLLPPGTISLRRGLPSTIAFRGIINGTFIGIEIYLPLMLQRIHGWDPFQAGLTLTFGSITWALGSFVQARVVDPDKRKHIATWGAFIMLVGCVMTIPVAWSSVSPILLIIAWSIAGLGIGMAFPAMATHALSLTPIEKQGGTSSALQLSDTLGASLAIAVAGIVFALIAGQGTLSFFVLLVVMSGLAAFALAVSFRVEPKVTVVGLPNSVDSR